MVTGIYYWHATYVCKTSYNGYQCAIASTSRWPRSPTTRCLVLHHRTWPTTAVLSPMLVSGGPQPSI